MLLTRTVVRSSAAAIVALLVSLPAMARPAAGSFANIRVDNFGRVNDAYYRGAQPRGRDYDDLAAAGVKTIIDLTEDGDRTEGSTVEHLGMKFFRIPMTTHETPSVAKIAQFLDIIESPGNQPVYVHCQGGRHRTGVMTAVYRITDEGWNADRAFAEMKQYNFGPDFLHPEFKRFVYAYRPDGARVAAAATKAAVPTKAGS